ncbi:hypothetical protein CYY_002834 [Polysphondylium violaceum]|uniref:PB1 domain-containing protein n=1 Tax=Polysphondylium violaceum TaxID=133409 RepID=A0A8J4PXI0_9MYCE|nr:hypothetical protein CYY_002834 [Polysphondylium violaceum]
MPNDIYIDIKSNFEGDIRRFSFNFKQNDFSEFLFKVKDIYKIDQDAPISITYTDDAGDSITLAEEDDLFEALSLIDEGKFNILRVVISRKTDNQTKNVNNNQSSQSKQPQQQQLPNSNLDSLFVSLLSNQIIQQMIPQIINNLASNPSLMTSIIQTAGNALRNQPSASSISHPTTNTFNTASTDSLVTQLKNTNLENDNNNNQVTISTSSSESCNNSFSSTISFEIVKPYGDDDQTNSTSTSTSSSLTLPSNNSNNNNNNNNNNTTTTTTTTNPPSLLTLPNNTSSSSLTSAATSNSNNNNNNSLNNRPPSPMDTNKRSSLNPQNITQIPFKIFNTMFSSNNNKSHNHDNNNSSNNNTLGTGSAPIFPSGTSPSQSTAISPPTNYSQTTPTSPYSYIQPHNLPPPPSSIQTPPFIPSTPPPLPQQPIINTNTLSPLPPPAMIPSPTQPTPAAPAANVIEKKQIDKEAYDNKISFIREALQVSEEKAKELYENNPNFEDIFLNVQ